MTAEDAKQEAEKQIRRYTSAAKHAGHPGYYEREAEPFFAPMLDAVRRYERIRLLEEMKREDL